MNILIGVGILVGAGIFVCPPSRLCGRLVPVVQSGTLASDGAGGSAFDAMAAGAPTTRRRMIDAC